MITELIVSLFFLNQQLITWGMKADCGSYVVTTYKTTELHEKGNEVK